MSVIEREHEQVQVDPAREERARVLEAAALEIEVRGWCQGRAEDDAGRVCMMGAVALTADDAPFDWLGAMHVWDPSWRRAWPDSGDAALLPLARWNDRPERKCAEVTFVLRWRAAEIRDGR